MTSAQALAFANRPWEKIREAKTRYLVARLRELGPAEAFKLADELRASVEALAGAPALASREADFAAHVRLHALLVRAGAKKRH